MTERTERECVFCRIVLGLAPAEVVHRWPDALAIVPLNPVAKGHLLVIPTVHVADALAAPEITAVAVRRAAQVATTPCNLITSVGPEATQTVRHLHWHVVPRAEGDGLALPWSEDDQTVVRTVGDLTARHQLNHPTIRLGGRTGRLEVVGPSDLGSHLVMIIWGPWWDNIPPDTPCEVVA